MTQKEHLVQLGHLRVEQDLADVEALERLK